MCNRFLGKHDVTTTRRRVYDMMELYTIVIDQKIKTEKDLALFANQVRKGLTTPKVSDFNQCH